MTSSRAGTPLFSERTATTPGNGCSSGGFVLTRGATDFPTISEDETGDTAIAGAQGTVQSTFRPALTAMLMVGHVEGLLERANGAKHIVVVASLKASPA